MAHLVAWLRFMLAAIAVAGLIALAAPALAQQQSPIIDPTKSVVNEQTLLRELPRIQGDIDQLDPRARVLEQPAGRVWDHFHEVTLYWVGVIVILGTLAALAAAYLLLGRTQGAALQGNRAVRALAHRRVVRRPRHYRAEHHLRKAPGAAADRLRRVRDVFGSCQVRPQFHELRVRTRSSADHRDLLQG